MSPAFRRKRVKHFNNPSEAHELTFSCYQRWPMLDDDFKPMFSRAIDAAVPRLGFSLVAFVYMPEHVHLIVWTTMAGTDVSALLFAIKKPVSFRIKKRMQETNDVRLRELTIPERPGKMTFRFWQEGPGFDRNIEAAGHLLTSAEYIHNNPVRRGLCAMPSDWKWSSWRHYHLPDSAREPDLPTVHGFPGGNKAPAQ